MARHCILYLTLAIHVNFLLGLIKCNVQVNGRNPLTPPITITPHSSEIDNLTSSENVTAFFSNVARDLHGLVIANGTGNSNSSPPPPTTENIVDANTSTESTTTYEGTFLVATTLPTSNLNFTSIPGATNDSLIPPPPPPLPPPPIFLDNLNTTSTVTPNRTIVDNNESTTVESTHAVSSSSVDLTTIAPPLHVTALPTTPTITEYVTPQYDIINATSSPFTSDRVTETTSTSQTESTVLSFSLVSETNVSDKDIAQGLADSLHLSSLTTRKKRNVSATSGRFDVTVLGTERKLDVTFANFTVSEDNVTVSAMDVLPLLSNTTVIISAFKNINITMSNVSAPVIVPKVTEVFVVETTTATASHTLFVPYTSSTDVSHGESEVNTASSSMTTVFSTFDNKSTVDAAESPTMSESSGATSQPMVTSSFTDNSGSGSGVETDESTMVTDASSSTITYPSFTTMSGSGAFPTYGDTDISMTTQSEYDISTTEFEATGSGEFTTYFSGDDGTVTTLVDYATSSYPTTTESEEPMTSGAEMSNTEFGTGALVSTESFTMAFTQTGTVANSTSTISSSNTLSPETTTSVDRNTFLTLSFTSTESMSITEQQIADIILEAILSTTSASSGRTRKRRDATASGGDFNVTVLNLILDASRATANFTVAQNDRTLLSSDVENLISVTNVETAFQTRSIFVSDIRVRSATATLTANTTTTYITCNVTVKNQSSIRIKFEDTEGQQIMIMITPRHKSLRTIEPFKTTENPVQISNLVPDTLYNITAEYGEFHSSCIAHTYPGPIKVIVGEQPMPNGAFVFVGSNPRVTQWEMQLEGDIDKSWNTSPGEYFGFL